MKKTLAVLTLSVQMVAAQNIAQKLDKVTKDLMDSSGAVSSSLSFYVSDENGNFIYE
jgi:D-alanyl-D-alanine carboxypeptidase/D-alanyl-D-alanine-endopeptidase (penicillin-binding protein 4)